MASVRILTILLTLSLAMACLATDEVDENRQDLTGLRINLASVFVEDQDEALRFYTEVLGFVLAEDSNIGQYRWLAVDRPTILTVLNCC